MGLHHELRDYLSRKLQPGEPQTYVEGGGNQDQPDYFKAEDRTRDQLAEFEEIYKRGGPVAQLIDIRAHMTFGTGTTFESEDEDEIEGQTVTEWLDEEFNDRDNLLTEIGRDAYIYGDSLGEHVETRGGGFSHLENINPKTMEPEWDNHGTIRQWEQVIKTRRGKKISQTFDADEVAHFTLQSLGRSPFGISLIGQNIDEIQRFAKNQEAIANYLRLHGFPKYHIQVGREDGPAVNDKQLKRVRGRFRDFDEKTNFTTGVDVNMEALDTASAEIEGISQHDMQSLAMGMGVPLEWTNYGGDGMGTGKPAESRMAMFERQARAEQRKMADQFIQQVVRPVLEEYSPFPRDVDVDLRFGDVVSDQSSTAEWLQNFKDDFTLDERREMLGFSGFDGDTEDLGTQAPSDNQEEGQGGIFMGDGTGNRSLSELAQDTNEEDAVLLEVFEHVVWGEDSERGLFTFDDEDVPQFAIERIKEAVNQGALFGQIDSISSGQRQELRETLLDSLEERHGWSLDSLRDNLRETISGLSKQDAEVIARTETASIVNNAREIGYEERAGDEELLFKWVGPNDHRETEACEELKERTEGGVTMEKLVEIEQEVQDEYFPDLAFRKHVIHPNERHTFVRATN